MNKFLLVLVSTFTLASFAIAADTVVNKKDENPNHKVEDTTTTSTNMMGTKTTKHKVKKHMKDANGKTTDAKKVDTLKEKTDGSVDHSVDADKKVETH